MTQGELDWIHAVLKQGCVVCRMKNRGYVPAEVHHLLSGGKRMGHRYTIGLCPTHHRGEPKVAGEFSRHKHHKRFNAEYGTDHQMWGRLIEKAR